MAIENLFPQSAMAVTQELAEPAAEAGGGGQEAATRLQKVYRSYRTRRKLADSAIVAEEMWWQLIDYARLNHNTISFFEDHKPETAVSRWNRATFNASKVGQGLSKDGKALKLAFQHWIEAIDPRHRYGHNLHFYYDEWCKSQAGQPFFYWLDIGEGRDLDLPECPRSVLKSNVIKYLGPKEREQYEYVIKEGKLVHKQTGDLLDTSKGSAGSKWIFVMSTTHQLYCSKKKKGEFQHSSFLAGGAIIVAGRLTTQDGILKSVWAYSGHYRPGEENLKNFLDFLKENGVDLDNVEVRNSTEDYGDDPAKVPEEKATAAATINGPSPPQLILPSAEEKVPQADAENVPESEAKAYKRTLSGGLQSPKAEVPKTAILERINSKRKSRSLQLAHQLSLKWSTGAGPRIGCIKDYPLELRQQALEIVNLSPRPTTPSPGHAMRSPRTHMLPRYASDNIVLPPLSPPAISNAGCG